MDFSEIIFMLVALLIAITVHEFSHAWLADQFGDPTPRLAGRVTLNPLAHLDLIGTFFLIFFKFGWGKPVPVNSRFFRHPHQESALVSLAGPFANFFVALLIAGFFYLFRNAMPYPLFVFLMTVFDLNLVLGIFNLVPLPPLDGSKVLGLFVPKRFEHVYERFLNYGMIYTMLFLLFDFIVMPDLIGYSLVSRGIGFIFAAAKGAIFLGA